MFSWQRQKTFKSINGKNWNLNYNVIISPVLFYADLLAELLVILLCYSIASSILMKRAKQKEIETIKDENSKRILEITKQVSHDIRSPLSAMSLIVGSLSNIPEDKRVIIRSSVNRITDIANQLLHNNSIKVSNYDKIDKKELLNDSKLDLVTVELLPALIDVLVSEKRFQFREKSNVKIETELEESYGAFAKIIPNEFKRVLSNTINNSVEALKREDGKIIIAVKNYATKTIVSIRDNGTGIPPHILLKLGQAGVTHGKECTDSGSGLGVYHAKKTIESFGAKFEINSQEGRGTEIKMEFSKCETPDWFVPTLNLYPDQIIVALDDDSSVLEIWKQRFYELNIPSITLHTYTSASGFMSWINSNSERLPSTLFLMDYELIGKKNNGLDLIEKLNLQDKAILVTSRYEETPIRKRCASLGVRQIPKGMAPFIPIEVLNVPLKLDVVLPGDDSLVNRPNLTKSTPIDNSNSKTHYDLCLIDDDTELIHAVWGSVAKSNGFNIKMFSTPQAFLDSAYMINRLTPIYIDVSLGNGVKGTDLALEIHKLGFTEINLATGYNAESIEAPSFIRRIVGKDFPIGMQ